MTDTDDDDDDAVDIDNFKCTFTHTITSHITHTHIQHRRYF